ncbi:MAG: ATP-dependent helicase HrpB [Gammaproteobacteria bacterium]|nr:ATP-dependent helicase HrpB [Gammaproteobacteria bacterium]
MRADPRYPIAEILPEILASLAAHPRLVLEAPPGAGKTTQVPLALLAAPWCKGKLLMLEPRRIAARAAATFMAEQLNEAVGATIGYRIRFERKISAQTRVEIVTEGILTRLLQEDPSLDGVAGVLFDEFHERHLASDLGLALCLEVQASLRPDLRLIVMSATLDGERIARYLDAPRLTSAGKSFPVTVQHLVLKPAETPALQLKRAIALALAETDGDVLCFLPGKAEIDRATRLLGTLDVAVEVLHGELAVAEQARILKTSATRRIVLATNVAESSVTLPGVCAVVDTGLAREPRFDPASGMSRLETVFVAQSSATQRAGRAGRVAAGRCYRLWPESQRLDPATRPELQRLELSALVLELKVWGSEHLRFLDPPPPGALGQAHTLLRMLDALDNEGRPTAHGKRLLELGVHPRLANAMLRAPKPLQGLACDLAALLEARDPLRGPRQRSDDLRLRVTALNRYRRGEPSNSEVARGVLSTIDQTAQHWRRRLGVLVTDALPDSHAVGDVLALAYPDRIAKKDEANPRRYQLSNGRGATLLHESALVGEPWLVIAEIRYDERDSLVLRAAPCDLAHLRQAFASHFSQARESRFNPDTRSVETNESHRFSAIVLEQRTVATPRNTQTAESLLAGIAQLGLECLPWSDASREWQARVQCLRGWCPELGLPDLNDAALMGSLCTWLRPALEGKARLSELAASEFAHALHGQLDYAQRQGVDEHAPTNLLVPSGQRRKLIYTQGESPVLAVKLQELFGLADTPRIAQGRAPVTLHLLSPRQTPIQVTQDLRGFWDRTYPEVKRELKGRYPKHPWPDDPWTATATHRLKPKANSKARNG